MSAYEAGSAAPRSRVPDPVGALGQLALAVAAHGAKDWDTARAHYDAALAMAPRHPDALHLRALLAHDEGDCEQATRLLKVALADRPGNARLHHHLGCALLRLQQHAQALRAFDDALARDPRLAAAHADRGKALALLRRPQEALAAYDRALALEPEAAGVHTDRGAALSDIGLHAQALARHDRAIALEPSLAVAHANRGASLLRLGRLDEALQAFERALALDPHAPAARYNKGCALLLLGDYERGWPCYEARRELLKLRHAESPTWTGEQDLRGRTILLHNDQGLGDGIMLSRFVTPVAALGARVVLEVQPALVPLLRDVEGAAQVIAVGQALPAFDLQCPLFSLPAALGLTRETMPGRGGYLHCDLRRFEAWSRRLGPRQGPRVGIAWCGNPRHSSDHWRSIDLERFAAAVEGLGLDLVCLQPGLRESDRRAAQARPWLRRFDSELVDFAETAALCAQLDLVVSVDTSVAHLAGAMGLPTWVLLPFVPDYRWLHAGQECPWYDSVRLLRQAQDARWEPVLQGLRAELSDWSRARCAR